MIDRVPFWFDALHVGDIDVEGKSNALQAMVNLIGEGVDRMKFELGSE